MNKIWLILILGLSIRIFLSYATLHPDIAAINEGGRIVSQGHIFTLYNFSSEAVIFNYPPLIYLFFGIFNFFFGGILWLFKLPYLIFDLMVGFLLYKLVDPKKSLLVFSLWIFNPINLYTSYMMGQFDIIPTFFSILSVYLVSKNRLNLAALALGGGIAFKLYPVFLIIPLILLGKNIWVKMKLIILTSLPYIISILPYLTSAKFRSTALFANQSSKSLYVSIPVSGGESIILFPAFLILIYLLIPKQLDKSSLWKFYLIPLLLFFIFTHYHPQWLIWITPFIILDLVIEKFKNIMPVIMIFMSWFASLFFFDPSLTIGLFNPIIPVLKDAPDIWNLTHLNPDYNFSRSLLQTILVAASTYLIIKLYKKENA